MSEQALRAIVLDNDETTGSYGLLFAIIAVLQTKTDITNTILKLYLKRLSIWMLTHGLFRPGIRNLLYTARTLRNRGLVDVIIMYTNQTENSYSDFLIDSVPKCIAYMFNYLSRQSVFNAILAKDGCAPDARLYSTKSFERILALFPNKPKDIREIIFIDDLASPRHIQATTIEPQNMSPDCWYAIAPYYRMVDKDEVKECIFHMFNSNSLLLDTYLEPIWNMYATRYLPKEVYSLDSAVPMLTACDMLVAKFGSLI